MAFKFGYFFRESGTNLRRNKLMTTAAVLTAAVSLVLLGGVLIIGDFVGGFTGELEEQVEVSVFLVDDITEEQKDGVQSTLVELQPDIVGDLRYVSKSEAFQEFKELYEDNPVITENVDESVLPASFRVKMADPERVDVIASKLEGNPAVEEIVDQRETVERLISLTGMLRTFSAGLVAVLFGAAVLLIANTIQLAIYARRKQIEIIKLVGATNWFVRVPFMLEGVAVGVAGAIIALVVLTAGKAFAMGRLPVWFPTATLQGVDPGRVLWLLVIGTVIGALGSAVALRRFLEV